MMWANGVPHTEQISSAMGFSAPQTEHGQNGSRAGLDPTAAGGDAPTASSEAASGGGTGRGGGSGSRRNDV
jgi:hypothetical protein